MRLHELFPNDVIHDQRIYRGQVAYFKSKDMEGKVTIFPSGKMISAGTTNIEKATSELELVAKALGSVLTTKPKVQNIVASASLGCEVDLDKIASMKNIKAIYEPDQFPSAIIQLPLFDRDAVASILLFTSGNLVCIGLKDPREVGFAITQLMSILDLPNARATKS